jgi:dCMP deaminase
MDETENKRESFPKYCLNLAVAAASRSTCNRRHVGAVVVRDRAILSTGYNGSMPGAPHCDEIGHLTDGDLPNCKRTTHAEVNAIAQAAKHGIRLDGATMFCTDRPCWECYKMIVGAGIEKVIYLKDYPTTYPNEIIDVIQFVDTDPDFDIRRRK